MEIPRSHCGDPTGGGLQQPTNVGESDAGKLPNAGKYSPPPNGSSHWPTCIVQPARRQPANSIMTPAGT